jgi:predicted nucleic-acid-binding protein
MRDGLEADPYFILTIIDTQSMNSWIEWKKLMKRFNKLFSNQKNIFNILISFVWIVSVIILMRFTFDMRGLYSQEIIKAFLNLYTFMVEKDDMVINKHSSIKLYYSRKCYVGNEWNRNAKGKRTSMNFYHKLLLKSLVF